MTDIDFKIALPFILPFIILGSFRLLTMLAGLPWIESVAFAALILSTISGVVVGGSIAIIMSAEGKKLTLKGVVNK